MPEIKVYTSDYCGYCTAAKHLLTSKGYQYEEINTRGDQALMVEIAQKSGQRTLPQIFVGEHSVGGYRELLAATSGGEFAELAGKQI